MSTTTRRFRDLRARWTSHAVAATMVAVVVTGVLTSTSSAAPVTPPTPPAAVPAADTVTPSFGSPFSVAPSGMLQVAPAQPFSATSSTTANPLAPDADFGCDLYGGALSHASWRMEFSAIVTCDEATDIQVESCGYIDVGGTYIRTSGPCTTNPAEGTTYTAAIEANSTIDCQHGALYKTWAWDYVPASSNPTGSGFSSAKECTAS